MKVNIKKEFAQDYTTRQAGEKLRKMILESSEEVELDFSHLKVASASFFDESIGKLPEEDGGKEALKKIKISQIHDLDYDLLVHVCQTRGIKAPERL